MSAAAAAGRRRGWCPGALRPMATGDGLLVRLRLTAGHLPVATARLIADLAARHGNGLIDLSSRANLQLRGVTEASLGPLLDELAQAGLLDETPAHETVRNVLASPLSDCDPTALCDALAAARALEAALMGQGDGPLALPAKFSWIVDDGGALPLDAIAADVRFRAFIHDGETLAEDEILWAIGLDAPEGTDWVGACPLSAMPDVARAIGLAFAEAMARDPGLRRMRQLDGAARRALLDGLKLEPLRGFPPHPSPLPTGERENSGGCGGRRTMEVSPPLPGGERENSGGCGGRRAMEVSPPLAIGERENSSGCGGGRAMEASPPLPGGERAGVRGPATVGVHRMASDRAVLTLALPFGRMAARHLVLIAGMAETEGRGALRLGPWRQVHLPGIAAERAVALMGRAAAAGFITDAADARLAVIACPGAPACGSGEMPAQQDAADMAAAAPELAGAGLSLHVSGCVKGCAAQATGRHPPGLTLVGRPGRYELVRGGATHARPIVALGAAEAAAGLARLAAHCRVRGGAAALAALDDRELAGMFVASDG